MTVDPFLIKTLEELIAYPTVSEDSNLPIINHIQNFLENYDINSHLIYNDEQTKANIFATVGPLKKGGVVLSGHTDVVPTKQQKWTTDPFTLTKKDNLYFGRGTADMKSFLAVTLSLIPKMVSANLKFPIHLAFSYDEEGRVIEENQDGTVTSISWEGNTAKIYLFDGDMLAHLNGTHFVLFARQNRSWPNGLVPLSS